MIEGSFPACVASPGLAYGTLRRDRAGADAEHEPASGLIAAVLMAGGQLRRLQARADALGVEVLDFQLELLNDDQLVLELLKASESEGSPQEAIRCVFGEQIAAYGKSDSELFASRAADLADLRDRLLSAFEGRSALDDDWQDDTILLVSDLTPSRFLALDRTKVIGIVDEYGSAASHVALLARSEGVPMLVGAGALPAAGEAQRAFLDAERGQLVIGPAAEQRAASSIMPAGSPSVGDGEGEARLPCGQSVAIHLTVNTLDVLESVPSSWFDGIGLVRSELLIKDARMLADAEAQAALYRPLFDWAGERPVTIRLIDAGGDKQVPGLAIPTADAGFLGLRGARLLMRRPEVLRTQLAAILAAAGTRGVRIMVPMVTLPEEMAFFRTELDRAAQASAAEKAGVRLGMMVETPAAALQAGRFDADFFAIGSNDLTQYTLAASRAGDARSVFADFPDAVLELVRRVVDQAAEGGRPVSMCGDVAAGPGGLGRLLDCGVRSFCVPPRLAAAFKQFIRSADITDPSAGGRRTGEGATGAGGGQHAGR